MKSSPWFNRISWGVTLLVVASLLGLTLWRVLPRPVAAAVPTLPPVKTGQTPVLPTISNPGNSIESIARLVALKTDLSQKVNYKMADYRVESGDALFSIARQYNIKPETLLWANSKVLQDNPDNLIPGQELVVPPVDGVYYQVKDGDTVDSIAKTFKANPDDILTWPGNNIDLTNPTVIAGSYVMVPGGKRDLVNWIKPVVARGRSGTAGLGGATCDGPIGTGGFMFPTQNHTLSGYDFSPTHLGIDLAAGLGAPIVASDGGVVVTAGWNNSGYGNVIMIDHGNGYSTVYGHLSQINVQLCQGVSKGQLIGLAGSTGNSTGPHLHFEVRFNGQFVNPWSVLE